MTGKFLLISQVFYPDQVSTANLFTDLCIEIAKRGIEVEVWAAHPSYSKKRRKQNDLNYNGIRIKYLPSTNFHKSNLTGRLLNTISFTFSASTKLLFTREKMSVWTHTTPPQLGICISFLCWLKKLNFVYILLDIFPEGLIRLGKLSRKNPFTRIWHRMFISALKRSGRIITLGRDMKKWIENECSELTGKIVYIPHWHNDEVIQPINFIDSKFTHDLSLQDNFVVQYSGNMGLWNQMSAIGKAANHKLENVIFVFVGDGIRKQELVQELDVNSDNIRMLNFQPTEYLNDLLGASHVQLVSLRQGLQGMAVPCKIYGILASGRPVIALVPKESEIGMLVMEENCGLLVDPDDTEGLINAIEKLKADLEYCKILGSNGRLAFEKKYSVKIIASHYVELFMQFSN